eukprot:gene11013-3719_t
MNQVKSRLCIEQETVTLEFGFVKPKESDLFTNEEFPLENIDSIINDSSNILDSPIYSPVDQSFSLSFGDEIPISPNKYSNLQNSIHPSPVESSLSSMRFGDLDLDDLELPKPVVNELNPHLTEEYYEVEIFEKRPLEVGCKINFISNIDFWIYSGVIKDENEKEFYIGWTGFSEQKDEWVEKKYCFSIFQMWLPPFEKSPKKRKIPDTAKFQYTKIKSMTIDENLLFLSPSGDLFLFSEVKTKYFCNIPKLMNFEIVGTDFFGVSMVGDFIKIEKFSLDNNIFNIQTLHLPRSYHFTMMLFQLNNKIYTIEDEGMYQIHKKSMTNNERGYKILASSHKFGEMILQFTFGSEFYFIDKNSEIFRFHQP